MRHETLFNTCVKLRKDRSGNISLIFALVAVPLIGCIGLATDYGRASRLKHQMQYTLDTATLGAVSDVSADVDLKSAARDRALADFQSQGLAPNLSVTSDPTHGTVTVSAETSIDTLFMGMLGSKETKIRAMSTAVAGAGGPTDVAIAFDTTGSMAGSKLSAAQEAATKLTDLLFKTPGGSGSNPDVRVGLVPFTYYVNVGTQYINAPWLAVPASQTMQVATGHAQLPAPGAHYVGTWDNDGVPTSYDYWSTDDYSHPIYTPTVVSWNGCVGSQPDPNDAQVAATSANPVPGLLNFNCPAALIRLSNDPTAIETAIAGISAGGETYIATGLVWGWRLISDDPKGPFADGRPASTTKKRLILMTDGANTHSADYVGNSTSPQQPGNHELGDVTAANAKTAQVCANIKAAGVQVYTIAFEVTDPTIMALLAQCSSGPPYYYNAQTIADLQTAFAKIGRDMTSPRLTN